METRLRSFVTHDDTIDRYDRYGRTLRRLAEFAKRPAGWDLGRGDPISALAIAQALAALVKAMHFGLWRSNVFASPSGSVLVTVTMNRHDIEIYVAGDGVYDFRYENAGEIVEDLSDLSFSQLSTALEKTAKSVCSSAPLTQIITTTTQAAFEAPHLSRQETEGYLCSGRLVRKAQAVQSVSISSNTTRTLQEVLQYSGYSQTPTFQETALAA